MIEDLQKAGYGRKYQVLDLDLSSSFASQFGDLGKALSLELCTDENVLSLTLLLKCYFTY